jgi:hypothetical protein
MSSSHRRLLYVKPYDDYRLLFKVTIFIICRQSIVKNMATHGSPIIHLYEALNRLTNSIRVFSEIFSQDSSTMDGSCCCCGGFYRSDVSSTPVVEQTCDAFLWWSTRLGVVRVCSQR